MKTKKGFTLIELMVVITIIAILAAIGAVMYSSTQKTARASKRIQDLKAVQVALETYKAANSNYPITTSWSGICPMYNNLGTINSTNYIPNLVPDYMTILPIEPTGSTVADQCYLYYSINGIDYKFLIHNIPEVAATISTYPANYLDPARPTSLSVYTLGGRSF